MTDDVPLIKVERFALIEHGKSLGVDINLGNYIFDSPRQTPYLPGRK